ncbi:MAG: T9SS type A sorting domain-containing protein [bacterium]
MRFKILVVFIFIQGIITAQNFWEPRLNFNSNYQAVTVGKDGYIFVSIGDRLYRSTDNGYNFNFSNYVLQATDDILSLGADSKKGYVYAGIATSNNQHGGIYASFDNGSNWQSKGLDNKRITDIVVDTGGVIIASSTADYPNGGVFRSTDYGNTWSNCVDPSYFTQCLKTDKYNNIYAGTEDPGPEANPTILKSTDRGNSWSLFYKFPNPPAPPTYIRGIGVDTTGNFLAYFSSKVYVSSDNGTTWTLALEGMDHWNKISFIVNKYNHLYAGFSGPGVYRSTDKGFTWESKNSGLTNTEVYCMALAGDYLFASTSHGIFRAKTSFSIPQLESPKNDSTLCTLTPKLIWNSDPTNIIWSRLQISTDIDFNSIIFDTTGLKTSECNIPEGKLEFNVPYYWRVIDSNHVGLSSWTEPWSFIVIIDNIEQNDNYPINYKLYQNYPNPFNPNTTIKFDIPKQLLVTVKIFDILGREIAVLVKDEKSPGSYEIIFAGNNLSSGIYFYSIHAGEFIKTNKMILAK